MVGYLVSLIMGLVVGVAYGLVQVRSRPLRPIALVGLPGMVMGERAIDMAKRHVSFLQASVEAVTKRCPRAPLAKLPPEPIMHGVSAYPCFLAKRGGLIEVAGRTRTCKSEVELRRGLIWACNR